MGKEDNNIADSFPNENFLVEDNADTDEQIILLEFAKYTS